MLMLLCEFVILRLAVILIVGKFVRMSSAFCGTFLIAFQDESLCLQKDNFLAKKVSEEEEEVNVCQVRQDDDEYLLF